MRKLFLALLIIPGFTQAQKKLNLTLFGGFSNYSGDLQSKRFTMEQANGAFGAGLRYELTAHLAVHGNLVYGKLSADDKLNEPSLRARNLSFFSKVYEGNLLLDYTLLDMQTHKVSPYLFAGGAFYRFNPYARDVNGRIIALRPLSTEGQGLAQYPDRKPYKIMQMAVPFGAGFRFRITDNATLGYEIGLRKLFTDYLDDVSTTYVDPAILAAAKGPQAAEYAYRGDELRNGNPVQPVAGSVRGGAKYKDWYYFSGITLSIGLTNLDGQLFGKPVRRGSTDCPKTIL